MSITHDAIVIGGGFAGVTAGRELQQSGNRTVLLEARDRLGGRTWTSEFAGTKVEMGGTWVHWHQPHVWAELRRYGLELAESPAADRAGWMVGQELTQGPADKLWSILNDGTNRMCFDSRDVFERPHDPLFSDISAVDALSIQDRVDQLGFDRETQDINDGAWSTCCSAYCNETGLVAALRWHALSGFDAQLMWDCIARYKIATGTKSLVDAIAADGGFETRLSTPVSSVEQDADRVAVRTRDGETLVAKTVIVAVPVNTLRNIEFTPELSAGKQAIATEGQSSHGVKIWIRVRGEVSYFATAPSAHGITFLQSEYKVGGDTLFVSFGPDAARLDPADKDAVAKVVSELLPGHEVVDVYAHNWTADEFAQGTWSMYRPNQLTRYLRDVQQPEGRVFLSGSDTANGWNGFIDGAIESGLSAARKAGQLLAG